MSDTASFFLEGWYVFDSFSPFQVEWRGKLYPTAEHAYQAAHFFDTAPEMAENIRLQRSPRLASDVANQNSNLDDPQWPIRKLEIMEEICRCKLDQHEYIQDTLRRSGDMEIIEANPSDQFWGSGTNGSGANELGKIWMKLRSEII